MRMIKKFTEEKKGMLEKDFKSTTIFPEKEKKGKENLWLIYVHREKGPRRNGNMVKGGGKRPVWTNFVFFFFLFFGKT